MRLVLRSAIFVLGFTVFVVTLAGCDSLPRWMTFESASAPVQSTPAPQTSAATSTAAPVASPEGFISLDVFRDVHFGPGSMSVLRADAPMLDVLLGWLREHPTAIVLIEGYTDDLGVREQNLDIAEQRARSIMNYLLAKGVELQRIALASYGADRAICTEKTAACRAQNRRVRFLVKLR